MDIKSALVKSILVQWRSYEWTKQGFGFVRTKIGDVGRIHIWDSLVATRNASDMHAHPWPLSSTVISGELINQRFRVDESGYIPYHQSKIKTGEGGGLIGEVDDVMVIADDPEHYYEEESYEQAPEEIHRSIAENGTVTLLERPRGPPLQETIVLWPRGTHWVSAEPKPAEGWEMEKIITYALARWSAA